MAEEKFLLGSGDLFLGVVPNVATATEGEILAALTNVGAIQGGAELTYSPTFVDVKSANRGTLMSFMTEEQVTFKTGLLQWDLGNIEKLSAAHFSEDNVQGTRRVGIGGLKDVPVNYLRFVHTKPDGKTLTVNIFKAQSQNGFALSFDNENPTVIDAEFKALSVTGKTNGNLVEIIDQVEVADAPTITAISPTSLAASDQPELITVTGTGFTPETVAIKDNFVGDDIVFRTLYDSPTQLTVEIKGLSAGSNTIRVQNGYVISDSFKTLTIS